MNKQIFKLSPFVTRQFKLTSELTELCKGELNLISDWELYKTQNKYLDFFSLLRKYRQSRLALIAVRDSNNQDPENHLTTLKLTSQLAKLLIDQAYQYALAEVEDKCGQVINTDGEQQSFIIFALGKLGGDELNYSSDVDLVFCYSGKGQSNGNKYLEAFSYFQRLGRRIIQILDSVTHDGFVYRVDMRLRPFGSAAPLICSINNLLNYLENEGRDWERYAWLRASFAAGNAGIANQALLDIQPFVYRKYLDYNIFESLRQIKAQITRKQQNDKDNIKMGLGGIREIEFIIQTLQLTFAGRNKQLRGNDLWQQMHNLHSNGHLSVNKLQQLTAAWLFLRRLENYCQIINDRDTHHLPKDTETLAKCLSFQSSTALIEQLQDHREKVHAIFKQLFLSNQQQVKTETNPQIQAIKDSISNKNFPKSTKHKIYATFDALIPYLHKTTDKEILINRYQQVIESISKRPSYLSMLIESPVILKKLVHQISHSPYFSKAIAKTPSLLELLFDPITETDFNIDLQWLQFSKRHQINDDEQLLEILCQFKQRIQFNIIVAYIDNICEAKKTGEILTKLAQFILKLIINKSWQHVYTKQKNLLNKDDLIVIAYGSLATKSMHLQSDFDIVFILDKSVNDSNYKFLMRWIKRIIHLLSVQTYSGNLYQLDTQLRPNGNSGAAIVSKNNFENYQQDEAWIWEHAALIKTRVISATSKQKQWFKQLREQVLTQKREAIKVDTELTEMAKKLNRAGMKDHQVEFNALGHILKNAHQQVEIIQDINKLVNIDKYTLKLNNSINA